MLTPGRRRRCKWLVWAERHSPIGDLAVGLPIDVKRLLWLLDGRQNQRPACLFGKRGRSADERRGQKGPSPDQEMPTINHECSPSFAHASESRTTYCCPHGPHRHSPPLPVKAGWRGVKPSLDALIDVAAAGSRIKAGASHRPMRIVRLAALIAPGDATGEQSPPGYSFGRGLDRQPFWRQCVCQHLQLK